MKKTIYLLGLVIATLVGCGEDEPVVKNYYGVQSASESAPQAAYYAFFAVALAIIVFVVWFLKRLGKK